MRRPLSAWSLAAVVLLAGCTAEQPDTAPPVGGASPTATSGPPASAPADPTAVATPSASARPSASASPSPSASAGASASTPASAKPDPVSMAALFERRYDGRDLRLGRRLATTDDYTRYAVSYRGDGERITGVLNIPDGQGPHPVLVLNHGYIDPDVYVTGQGMRREQDQLARRGFAVLHIDYRNHAGSSKDPDVDVELRLPYVVDTINAVKAVRSSSIEQLDGERVGWLGRSMGGEVTLRALAAQPGLVDAAVVYASTSSLTADNWRQFNRGDGDRAAVNRAIEREHGLPADAPAFWRAASARPYFDRVTEPVLVHHGTADDTCPFVWAERTVDALEKADVDVTFRRYRGAGHTFWGEAFDTSIERTADFFDEHLD